ncbi:MAG: class I SAM-dependent methyltransferase [Gammaproteobacteria bacterium]|nr:class I SAM-dependent methyltransferase [Gammaproteobacteria bacterium]
MGLYDTRILPVLIHAAMRQQNLTAYRRRVAAEAFGDVVEIGVGSGLNFPFYTAAVKRVIGIDPSAGLLRRAARAAEGCSFRVDLLQASAEALPLADRSADTVVTTWSLCSVPDVGRALSDMRRVLRPSGRLLFVEHGRSADAAVVRWQDRLTPAWKRVAGGCHLNRSMAELIEAAGFAVDRLETGYMKGPKPMTFMYEGSARPG